MFFYIYIFHKLKNIKKICKNIEKYIKTLKKLKSINIM